MRNSSSPNGVPIKYISWYSLNDMLTNYAPGWEGEIRSITYAPDRETVTVVYRITIHAAEISIFRDASGTAVIKGKMIGDPVQKAEAMAFRRACARFGLGLYLYKNVDQAA